MHCHSAAATPAAPLTNSSGGWHSYGTQRCQKQPDYAQYSDYVTVLTTRTTADTISDTTAARVPHSIARTGSWTPAGRQLDASWTPPEQAISSGH
jgi:hypothetical protein